MSNVTNVLTVEAYRTTGTSPAPASVHGAPTQRPRSYDRVHLLGPGTVGCGVLELIAHDRCRLVAVTDSTGTIASEEGLPARDVIAWKRRGLPLRAHPLALRIDNPAGIAAVDADVLIDTTSSDLDRAGWTGALDAALARGACLISAAKASLCTAGAEWLSGDVRARIGINAVLGGTGRSFLSELDELRAGAHSIAIVGNASTTAIIEAIERGATLAEGIADAQQRGFLEPDPELDLRGTDAAVKLAIVAGAVTGRRIDPRTIPCEDVRDLDLRTIRSRRERNLTTRLVARWRHSELAVRYEEITRDSVLAAPCGRVVYEYGLAKGERRLHMGAGLGAAATAAALWTDFRRIPRLVASHRAAAAGTR